MRARCPLIYVQTYEEERVSQEISYLADSSKPQKVIRDWDFCTGFADDATARQKPLEALEIIAKTFEEANEIYLLKDFHRFIEDLAVSRMLRNLYRQLKKRAEDNYYYRDYA